MKDVYDINLIRRELFVIANTVFDDCDGPWMKGLKPDITRFNFRCVSVIFYYTQYRITREKREVYYHCPYACDVYGPATNVNGYPVKVKVNFTNQESTFDRMKRLIQVARVHDLASVYLTASRESLVVPVSEEIERKYRQLTMLVTPEGVPEV